MGTGSSGVCIPNSPSDCLSGRHAKGGEKQKAVSSLLHLPEWEALRCCFAPMKGMSRQ